ncbi:hypothetical protein [Nitrosomonas supralitoralis]|nr:hypothetical protein [Nitrosomonas supralitoralis]
MDEKEEIAERVRLLMELIDSSGGIAPFCRKYSKEDAETPISPTYVSQLKNGSRSFGFKAARKMEDNSTLPKYYFDPWRKQSKTNEIFFGDESDLLEFLGLNNGKLDFEQLKRIKRFVNASLEKQEAALETIKSLGSGGSKEAREGPKGK